VGGFNPAQPFTATSDMSGLYTTSRWLIFAVLLSAALTATSAELYKWTDSRGRVHYGDKPPDDAELGHKVYNQQGVEVGEVARALNNAERAESRRREQAAAEQARLEEERQLRDRVLLETFTTERDLLLARDDRVGAIDAAIALSSKHLGNWQGKLQRVNDHIEQMKTDGQVVPTLLIEERESLERKIAGGEEFTAQKMAERAELSTQFDADIARFRELKQEQARLAEELGRD
jgi:hypothetical protein